MNVIVLLNGHEKKMYHMLKNVLQKNFPNYDVHPKIRVADVIVVGEHMERRELFRYALMAHFDFIVFHKETYMPYVAFEFDGPDHDKPDQKKKDEMKDELCEESDFPICRFYYKDQMSEIVFLEKLVEVL